MAVAIKGTTYATTNQVTAANLNSLVDSLTFDTGAVDSTTTQLSSGAIIVRDAGITSAKLDTNIAVSGTFGVTGATSLAGTTTTTLSSSTGAFSGTLSPAALVDISGASAGQIKFPATQNASSNANTLDDYEEGTWTPSLGGTATYTAQNGRYTKIGRQVFVSCNLTVNAIGTGSTYAITGLPFASSIATSGCVGPFTSAAATFTYVGCFISTSTITITVLTAAAASSSSTPTFFGAGTDVFLSVSYHV